MFSCRAGLGVVQVYGPLEVRTKSPKCLGHMKQRDRAGFGVVRVYSPLEVRTKSPKRFGYEAPEQFTGPIRVKN